MLLICPTHHHPCCQHHPPHPFFHIRAMYAHLFDSLRREAISADGNAFKVLRWAVKHKHTDIIDKAAQSAISLPITRVRMVLEPNLYLAWVRCLPPLLPWILFIHTLFSTWAWQADYQRLWMETLQREMTRYPPTQAHWNSNTRESDLICEPWTHAYALFMHKLAGKPWHLLQCVPFSSIRLRSSIQSDWLIENTHDQGR